MNKELESWIDEMIEDLEPINLDLSSIFEPGLLEELYKSLMWN